MAERDLMIVLGKNIGVGSSVEDIRQDSEHLSAESRMNARAAGIVYETSEGGVDLLFSAGHTAGKDIATEAAAMKDHMMREFPDIPEGHIHTEEKSLDTRMNAIEVAKLLPALPNYDRIDLLSVFYHVGNAAKLFRRLGVPIERARASDEIIRKHSPEDQEFVQSWFGSERIRREVHKERVRSVLLSTIDQRGRLLHVVTQHSRG